MKKHKLAICLALLIACVGTVIPAQAETTNTEQTQTTVNNSSDTADNGTEPTRFVLEPSGISKTTDGSFVIADRTHQVVRVRDAEGTYRVPAGTEDSSGYKNGAARKALFNSPWDAVFYKSGWLISDSENHALRFYRSGKVTTVAGTGKAGYKNATGQDAQFNRPTGMAVGENGEVYISDTGNACVRKLSGGKVTTLIKAFSLNDGREPAEPCGLMIRGGKLYVGDIFTEELIEFDL